MKNSWLSILGLEKEEFHDVIIALVVIALFAWLTYHLGWFKGDLTPSPVQATQEQTETSDSDNDGVTNANDRCPLVLGVAANAGCPADIDKDGIYDRDDQCPDEAGIADNNGCEAVVSEALVTKAIEKPQPDTDKDGFIDANDECPEVAGTLRGCPPDADNDGVIDSQDQCPELEGVSANNGCPADSDKDGVYDTDDACASLAGIKENNGCPADTDNDNVYDKDDRCPSVAGVKINNGCPADADNDGISDNNDKCPNQAGISKNSGCPEIKITEEDRSTIAEAVKNIQFFSNSARPTEQSKQLLSKVAEILKANPSYKLKISGHTDSSGDADANLTLSKKRAFVCFSYLVNNGIASKRLAYEGFGATQPIAENTSREGRKQNRRVEFELHF